MCAILSRPHSTLAHVVIFAAIGILGATVMPHSLFLGSALATQEREDEAEAFEAETRSGWGSGSSLLSTFVEKARTFVLKVKAGLTRDSVYRSMKRAFYMGRVHEEGKPPRNHAEHENHSVSFVQRHLTHGIVDMVVSLLGIALVINALCVFYSRRDSVTRLTGNIGLSFLPAQYSSTVPPVPATAPRHYLMRSTYWKAD